MKFDTFETISCPHCGTEYLPAEIYYPDTFLGKPKNILKTTEGKIVDYTDESMNVKENYICDTCGTKFRVTCKVKFKAEKIIKESFNEDYITKIPKKLNLFED